MKKILLLLIVFLLGKFTFYAQDLIVLYPEDSLNVKIEKILSDRIIYTEGLRTLTMPSRNVKNFQKNFYLEPVKIKKENKTDNLVFHIGGDFSWSYRLAAVPDNANAFQQEYIKDIKSGYSYGISLGLFATENLAIGLSVNRHRSTVEYNDLTFVYSTTPGKYKYLNGSLRDDITIEYIAPTLFYQFSNFSETINFLLSGSIGFNTFKNVGLAPFPVDSALEMSSFTLKGSSFGLGVGLSADIKVEKYFYIGPQVSFYTGTITRFSMTNKTGTYILETTNPEEGESLLRMNLGGNIRFYF